MNSGRQKTSVRTEQDDAIDQRTLRAPSLIVMCRQSVSLSRGHSLYDRGSRASEVHS